MFVKFSGHRTKEGLKRNTTNLPPKNTHTLLLYSCIDCCPHNNFFKSNEYGFQWAFLLLILTLQVRLSADSNFINCCCSYGGKKKKGNKNETTIRVQLNTEGMTCMSWQYLLHITMFSSKLAIY